MISSVKPFALLAIVAFSAFSYANDWERFQEMPDGRGHYDISLIEKSGFFSKEFNLWLRANFYLDENECGSAPSATSINYSADPAEQIKQALSGQNVYRNYAICTQGLSAKNKTAIYKVRINCSENKIESTQIEATNYKGVGVPAEIQIKSYPGSIGHELISHYCN